MGDNHNDMFFCATLKLTKADILQATGHSHTYDFIIGCMPQTVHLQ